MKFSSKLVALMLVCLSLAACNKPVEEKAPANEGNDAEKTTGMLRELPECAQRNKNGTYKFAGGCSAEQWVEWQKKQDAVISPSK
ncbi:MAG: hypothetical protein NUV63_04585 [Gallionella sp.]|nr:hypothetical protein [Gallionella sp.]